MLIANYLSPQVNQEWAKRYNSLDPGTGAITKSIAIDSSGNIYVAGQDAGYDLVLLKYSSNGGQIYARYGAFGGAEINYIAVDPSGDIYLAGKKSGIFLVKYYRTGVKMWERNYPGNIYSGAVGLVITPSGYPIVAGTIRRDDFTKEDYCAIKYTPNGDSVWTRLYNSGGNNRDEASSLALAFDGSICISGSRWNSVTGMYHNYLTIKYDSNGVWKWASLYGSSDSDYYAEDAVFDKLGNIHITGTLIPGIYQTVKYNNNGILIWNREFTIYSSSADKINVDRFGNVFVSGQSPAPGHIGSYVTTLKYDSTGNQKWVNYFTQMNDSSTSSRLKKSMVVDYSGNIYLTGNYDMRNWPPPAMKGMFTVKYKSDGSIGWIKEFHGNNNSDGGIAIVLDRNNNIYVTGNSYDSAYKWGIMSIKYSQTVGINGINSNISDKYFLSQNYPNPFNSFSNIRFQIPKNSHVILKVFDMLGKEIITLINSKLNSGEYELSFDGSSQSSGIYFYSLYVDGYLIDTKKLVLLK